MHATGTLEPRARRWTIEEYYQMADLEFFQDQRVELIDGEIIEMSPQRDLHVAGVGLAGEALRPVFSSGYWIRVQAPLHLGESSEPEPDIAVVPGSPRDYVGTGHPTTALLVVEVSETTLAYDRKHKASLYAAAGIGDYWIVNLVDNRLEVYRKPVPDPSQPFGFRYAEVLVLDGRQSIAPLAMPDAVVPVADLLP